MTQEQLCESARRQIARRNQFFDWLNKQPNCPTTEELERLKKKNPKWNSFQLIFSVDKVKTRAKLKVMKMILLLLLTSLHSRLAAAEKVEDIQVRNFAKRLALAENRQSLSRIL